MEVDSDGSHTHTHTSHICPNSIEKWYHVFPLRHRALETRIECITGEEGSERWLSLVPSIGSVVIDN